MLNPEDKLEKFLTINSDEAHKKVLSLIGDDAIGYHENFGFQWNRFNKLQLDSCNGSSESEDRLLNQSELRPEDFRDKVILEVGAGNGRFTEILLKFGAKVIAVDFSSAIFANFNNHQKYVESDKLICIRGDVFNLPVIERAFDMVLCYGVIQHTGNNKKAMEGFYPKVDGFDHFEFGDHKSLEKSITNKTAAIMVETIMGEGGIKVIPDWCLKELRKLCNKKKILLILDEVQCGISRSGDFFAFEKSKVKPDIVPIAKGIGGGFPIGAVLMNKKVSNGMTPGTHGSTFGGNPLAMAVGNTVMDIVSNRKFLNNIKKLSKYFLSNLDHLKNKYPNIIKEIRGRGLLIGIQLQKDQTKFIQKLMDNRLLTIRAAENVVRILPPLNVKKNEIYQALKIINKVCLELK